MLAQSLLQEHLLLPLIASLDPPNFDQGIIASCDQSFITSVVARQKSTTKDSKVVHLLFGEHQGRLFCLRAGESRYVPDFENLSRATDGQKFAIDGDARGKDGVGMCRQLEATFGGGDGGEDVAPVVVATFAKKSVGVEAEE